MSFGVTRDYGQFEWAGRSLGAIFAQRLSFLSPRRWRLLFDIIRFNQFALDVVINDSESDDKPTQDGRIDSLPGYHQISIGEYLDREGYSQTFKDDYLIPMTAMVWSTTPDKCSLQFPALTLIRFMWNHHLLNTITDRPAWLTIPGGSKRYIDAVMKDFPKERVHLDSEVKNIEPGFKGKVKIRVNGEDLLFDHVILATHGDQAREIMKNSATKLEHDILRGFETSHNIAVLHSDLSLMPKRKITWSAWNFVTESPFPPNGKSNVSKICLTYWMNLLQHIDQKRLGPVLVPLHPPKPELTQGLWEYSHPLYNSRAIQSQKMLPIIQNQRGVSYCGAWTKYGFHEDGFSSGIAAAQDHLGAKLPFDFVDSTFSRGQKPRLTLKNYLARLVIRIIQLAIVVVASFWSSITSRFSAQGKIRLP